MKSNILRRLARLEDDARRGSGEPNPQYFAVKKALIAIVAAHVGEWEPGQAMATACANALEISASELKQRLGRSPSGPWAATVAHLETLAGPSGGTTPPAWPNSMRRSRWR
jgi:hypothetical protein